MLAERLNKAWNARRNSGAIDVTMRFASEGLVLGAGTILAKSDAGGGVSIDPSEPRLRALLTAAHLRSPTTEALTHLRKGAERWSEGERALAAMHLALSRIDRLERPEADAHRLFLADGLLDDGLEASTIVSAVEAGGAAFDRLHKYDDNQPRVPAGSGRSSGEWTSGDGGSSVGVASQADFNPGVLPHETQRIESVHACLYAQADCKSAAIEAAAHDPPNDKRGFIDKKNCENAGLACDALSWATEDLPLPLSGGVIFPHGGVVLIRKGRLDVYIRPLPGWKTPPIRRVADDGRATSPPQPQADGFSWPPASPSPNETVVSGAVGFSPCQRVVNALASKMNGRISDQTYSQSKQWGTIIRAKIAYNVSGASGTACIICWSGAGPDVKVAMTMNCC